MNARTDEFRRQVNELWKQAVDQLEVVKDVVVRQTDRFDAELQWLRSERDRLLKRLGEQTHKLAREGKLPMPAFLKSTVDRLDDVLDRIVAKQGAEERAEQRAEHHAEHRRGSTKKTTRKKSTRKGSESN